MIRSIGRGVATEARAAIWRCRYWAMQTRFVLTAFLAILALAMPIAFAAGFHTVVGAQFWGGACMLAAVGLRGMADARSGKAASPKKQAVEARISRLRGKDFAQQEVVALSDEIKRGSVSRATVASADSPEKRKSRRI